MKKYLPVITLLVILILPLVTWMVLRTGTHRVKPLPILSPPIANPDGSPDSVYKTVGDFAFLNQNGDTVTLDSLRGHIWVADVFFTTCPGICPKLSAGLQKVQDYFRETKSMDVDLKLLSITVDPETDSVAALREYADRYGADDDMWYFVTGNKKDLYEFAHKEFFFKATEDSTSEIVFIHDNTLRLVDKEGRFRGMYYDGTKEADVDLLRDHIKILHREYEQDK